MKLFVALVKQMVVELMGEVWQWVESEVAILVGLVVVELLQEVWQLMEGEVVEFSVK